MYVSTSGTYISYNNNNTPNYNFCKQQQLYIDYTAIYIYINYGYIIPMNN